MIVENLKCKEKGDYGIILENDKYLLEIVDILNPGCRAGHYIKWGYGLDQITDDIRFTFDTDNIDTLIEQVPDYGIRLIPTSGIGNPIPFPVYGCNNSHCSSTPDLFVQLIDKEKSSNEYTDIMDIRYFQNVIWD